MTKNNSYDTTKDEILQNLTVKNNIRTGLDLEFLVDELSKKLTPRQAIILRLRILDMKSQVDISKTLGFSAPTISLEMRKIKNIVEKFYRER